MKLLGKTLACLLLITTIGLSQEVKLSGVTETQLPSVEVVAPSEIGYGRLVVIGAKLDRSSLPQNLISIKYQWSLLVNGRLTQEYFVMSDARSADEGAKLVFSSGVEQAIYTVVLDIDCLYGSKTGDKDNVYTDLEVLSPELITKEIVVGGGPPPVPPGPGPGPNPPDPAPVPVPEPAFPPGQYDLSKFAFQLIQEQTQLTVAERKATANALADGLEGIASQIGAIHTYRDIEVILADTKKAIDKAYAKANVPVTKLVAMKDKFEDEIYRLYDTNKLTKAEDFQVAWQELVIGLRAAGR